MKNISTSEFEFCQGRLTPKERVEKMISSIQDNKHIFTTHHYNEETLLRFKGKQIENASDIANPVSYVSFLESCLMNDDYEDLPNEIIKDLCYANKKGIVCFYLTVVLNMILRDVHEVKDIQMIQGFFDYDSTFFGFTQPIATTGVHAFSLVHGGVIDTTFYPQNADYVCDQAVMFGVVPDDIGLYGWTEPLETEQAYINLFAKKNHGRSINYFKLCHLTAYQDFLMSIASLMEQK